MVLKAFLAVLFTTFKLVHFYRFLRLKKRLAKNSSSGIRIPAQLRHAVH